MPAARKTRAQRTADQDTDPAAIAAQRAADYRAVFRTEQGQRVLAHLCDENGIFDLSFRGESPEMTAWREGRRAVILDIIQQLNVDPTVKTVFAEFGQTESLFPE